jgi:hypothetical protein
VVHGRVEDLIVQLNGIDGFSVLILDRDFHSFSVGS